RASRRRWQAFHIDIVFDGDRNAVERQRRLAGLLQSARLGKNLRFIPERDENRWIVVHADSRKASRDDVLGPGGAGAISFKDFGCRLRQWRLRIAREKRARNRVRWPLCAKSGAFRNGYGTSRRARGHRNKATGCVGSGRGLYSFGFSVIVDDVSGFART